MASPFQFVVEFVEQDVGQKRRQRPALRRADGAGLDVLSDQHTGAQVAADQGQQRLVADRSPNDLHQHVVIDGVEELGEVDVHGNGVAVLHIRLYLFDRLVGIAARSEAEARRREARFEDRREHLGDGLLDDPVHHGRDAQQPLAAVVLGDFHPADGLRTVTPGFELAAGVFPVRSQVGGKVLYGDAVDARRALVGFHAFPCTAQVVAGEDGCQ
ncbi:hypothetical protein SDC9_136303 [bioreactor metagenome]|uniref:Uncharacterized protein n=1 Tax=bioreactor metagenome TaxID=1076179 RepID=A0A645DIX3_9ZZZZ